MTKKHILDQIKRTATANGGKPLGQGAFERETGIRVPDWFGKYWKAWGEALIEAGYKPNTMQPRLEDELLLTQYARLVAELGRIPVKGDLLLKRRRDSSFPSHNVFFRRYGSRQSLLDRLRAFCEQRPEFAQIFPLIPDAPLREAPTEGQTKPDPVLGYVYLLKSGRHYKIGKSNAFGRRERELAIQLPEKPNTVHVIKTDDPAGIEEYWHKRFAPKRRDGEWFTLTADDVAAFKRRRFQ